MNVEVISGAPVTDGRAPGEDDGTDNPLLGYHSPAEVLLDRVQLGISVVFPTVAASEADAFCAALVEQRLLSRKPRRGQAMRARLALGPFPVDLPLGGRAQVGGQIVLTDSGGHLAISRKSHVLPNLMRALRSQLPSPGERATDGDDNLVLPYGEEYRHLLGLQLADAALIVDALVASLAGAAETAANMLRGQIWVQMCEVARDHAVPDAEEFVRDVSGRPIPGAGQTRLRSVVDRGRAGLSLSWHEGASNSAERKLYAKRHDLVRTEVVLRRREAVAALLSRAGMGPPGLQGLSGAEVAGALSDVARASAPLIEEIVGVGNEILDVPPRAGVEIVVALAPLIKLVIPSPPAVGAGGRRSGPRVASLARRVLDMLVAEGVFDARGFGSSDAVLKALREMEAGGALRASLVRPRLFAVHPTLEAARQALAAVRQWPADTDPPADGDASRGE